MTFCRYPTNQHDNVISSQVNGRFVAFDECGRPGGFYFAGRLMFVLLGILIPGLLLFPPSSSVLTYGDDNKAPAEAAKQELAKDLIGAWTLVGEADKSIMPDSKSTRIKLFTKKHWSVTQYNKKTGDVEFHHGGTYSLEGDNYSETMQYANKNTKYLMSKDPGKFKIKIEGDTLTLIGIGNPWTEVLKRAD